MTLLRGMKAPPNTCFLLFKTKIRSYGRETASQDLFWWNVIGTIVLEATELGLCIVSEMDVSLYRIVLNRFPIIANLAHREFPCKECFYPLLQTSQVLTWNFLFCLRRHSPKRHSSQNLNRSLTPRASVWIKGQKLCKWKDQFPSARLSLL